MSHDWRRSHPRHLQSKGDGHRCSPVEGLESCAKVVGGMLNFKGGKGSFGPEILSADESKVLPTDDRRSCRQIGGSIPKSMRMAVPREERQQTHCGNLRRLKTYEHEHETDEHGAAVLRQAPKDIPPAAKYDPFCI